MQSTNVTNYEQEESGLCMVQLVCFLMLKAKSERTGRERTKRNIKEIPDDA